MRSRRDDVPAAASVDRGLRAGVVGVGDPSAGDDRAERRLERFVDVVEGSFVWTRAGDGSYRLGRITGPWHRDTSHAAAEVDLVHVRPCDWVPVPVEDWLVPAAVRATYARGGRNFQQVHDPAVAADTERAWNLLTS